MSAKIRIMLVVCLMSVISVMTSACKSVQVSYGNGCSVTACTNNPKPFDVVIFGHKITK